MSTWQRDLVAIAITVVGFWLLRHDLFEQGPDSGEVHQAADAQPSSNLRLDACPGEDAPSCSEPFEIHPGACWSARAVERTLAEIASL